MKKTIYTTIPLSLFIFIFYIIFDEKHSFLEFFLLISGILSMIGFCYYRHKKQKEDLDRIDEGYNFYRNKLLQSQKMEIISEFSRGVAHDFNNSLTSINGYVDLIDIDLEMSKMKKTRAYVDGIRKNIESASSLTNKLMTFSKNQIIDARVCNINDIITDFFDIMSKSVGESIQLQLSLNATKLVKVDKGQIEQILLNLVLNAKDAILELNPENPLVVIETYDTPTNNIILRCRDNGMGMSKETKDRLFEPFFTTKALGQGLGLTSIYGIVKQNCGIINVYSELLKGTTFEIFLPITNEEAKKTISSYRKKNKSGNGEKILFVEDNQSIREVFSQYLSKYNYQVIEAENGKDALDKLDGVNLIITDVVMPEMGGYEFVQKVKELNPDIKIIFTSGYSSTSDNLGYCLIKKPYTLTTMLQKIQKILSE